jgi:hypothetical protein
MRGQETCRCVVGYWIVGRMEEKVRHSALWPVSLGAS